MLLMTSIHASADDVVDKAVNYVFSKDREFQEFLKTSEAQKVTSTLRIRRATGPSALEQANKKPASGVESSDSVQVLKA